MLHLLSQPTLIRMVWFVSGVRENLANLQNIQKHTPQPVREWTSEVRISCQFPAHKCRRCLYFSFEEHLKNVWAPYSTNGLGSRSLQGGQLKQVSNIWWQTADNRCIGYRPAHWNPISSTSLLVYEEHLTWLKTQNIKTILLCNGNYAMQEKFRLQGHRGSCTLM
jgi:hypothetical protein